MNFIIYYSVILDPRFKLHYVGWAIKKIYPESPTLVDQIKYGIYELFDEYKRLNDVQESNTWQPSSVSSSSSNSPGQSLWKKHLDMDTRCEYDMFISDIGGIDMGVERERDIASFDTFEVVEVECPKILCCFSNGS